jgi:ComF family protein
MRVIDAGSARQVWLLIDELLLPATCLICHKIGGSGLDLCASCCACLPALACGPSGFLGDGPELAPVCLGCGDRAGLPRVLFEYDQAAVDLAGRFWCAACQRRDSPFRRIVAPWRYAYPVDGMIGSLKRHGRRPIARALGRLLGDEVRRVADTDTCQPVHPDIVVPVPDHAERRRQRGFNPAADIARSAAARLDLPFSPRSARRVLDSGPLANKSRAERALAIGGAFRVDDGLHGQHVALVDDVLTSGATSRELARECLDAGAASVELWVLARTSSD